MAMKIVFIQYCLLTNVLYNRITTNGKTKKKRGGGGGGHHDMQYKHSTRIKSALTRIKSLIEQIDLRIATDEAILIKMGKSFQSLGACSLFSPRDRRGLVTLCSINKSEIYERDIPLCKDCKTGVI